MVSHRVQAGSRLAMTVEINKRPDQQINCGSGDDVSEESLEDARAPVRIRWHEHRVNSQPLRRNPRRRSAYRKYATAAQAGTGIGGAGPAAIDATRLQKLICRLSSGLL
jgi:hypothetical protein